MLNFRVNDSPVPVPYPEIDMETMGKRISQMREQKGWSQDQLARLVGVTKATVSQWENDVTTNIRPENLLRLCEEFGTDPWYVVFGPERRAPVRTPPRKTGAA